MRDGAERPEAMAPRILIDRLLPHPPPGRPLDPQAAVEDPEAVRQLHRKFVRAGADVMQADALGDKLTNPGN